MIQHFERVDAALKAGDKKMMQKFADAFSLNRDEKEYYSKHFLESIWKAYSAKSTKHKVATTKTLQGTKGEVWIGGKVMVISIDMWAALVKARHGRRK